MSLSTKHLPRADHGDNAAVNLNSAHGIAALLSAGAALSTPMVPRPTDVESPGIPFTVIPDGYDAKSLESLLPTPTRRRANITTGDVNGFILWTARESDPERSVLFEETKDPVSLGGQPVRLCGWIGVLDAGSRTLPGWGENRIVLEPSIGVVAERWLSVCGKPISQRDLAEFLEENGAAAIQPTGADLLEMALNLEATTSAKFEGGVRLQNGNQSLTYTEQTDTKMGNGKVEVPQRIVVRCSLLQGLAPVDLTLLLRYRLEGGSIRFTLKPHRLQELIVEQVREIRALLAEKLPGLPLVVGKP
jgi:uncharacterized protein YfdQ (DUF2303 family)